MRARVKQCKKYGGKKYNLSLGILLMIDCYQQKRGNYWRLSIILIQYTTHVGCSVKWPLPFKMKLVIVKEYGKEFLPKLQKFVFDVFKENKRPEGKKRYDVDTINMEQLESTEFIIFLWTQ